MTYSFDEFGWLSDTEIPGRVTGAVPPEHGSKTVGQMYPNWTGVAWVMVPYAEPPAPEPAPTPRTLSRGDFMKLFTKTELVGIYSAAKVSVEVEVWLEQFRVAAYIDLDDPLVIAGLQDLVAGELLGSERPDEILA